MFFGERSIESGIETPERFRISSKGCGERGDVGWGEGEISLFAIATLPAGSSVQEEPLRRGLVAVADGLQVDVLSQIDGLLGGFLHDALQNRGIADPVVDRLRNDPEERGRSGPVAVSFAQGDGQLDV